MPHKFRNCFSYLVSVKPFLSETSAWIEKKICWKHTHMAVLIPTTQLCTTSERTSIKELIFYTCRCGSSDNQTTTPAEPADYLANCSNDCWCQQVCDCSFNSTCHQAPAIKGNKQYNDRVHLLHTAALHIFCCKTAITMASHNFSALKLQLFISILFFCAFITCR